MGEENRSKLIELAKEACKITWKNEDTERKIKRIVEDAVPYLLHKLGIQEKDDELLANPGGTRMLFEKYCLYAWNDVENEFEDNYKREILTERHKYEVKYEREKKEQLQ